MTERVFYVRHIVHDIETPEAERMRRVAAGHHCDYWSELVECDEHGSPIARDDAK